MKSLKQIAVSALIAASIVAVLFCAFALHEAAMAGATPQDDNAQLVCVKLDANSMIDKDGDQAITDQGITNVIHRMMQDGLTPEAGGQVLADGVRDYCPGWRNAIVQYFEELSNNEFTVDNNWIVHYPARQLT